MNCQQLPLQECMHTCLRNSIVCTAYTLETLNADSFTPTLIEILDAK